jgi:hypothetical protein
MWLINVNTLRLETFLGEDAPPYAILSHTWGMEEVSFSDITRFATILPNTLADAGFRQKLGFLKISGCCAQARKDGLNYVWIDTCCIDKTSSAELSEAINSMFKYYERSDVCYVYLSDVLAANLKSGLDDETFVHSRWFERGWTLQELVAPVFCWFFDKEWDLIGTKSSDTWVDMFDDKKRNQSKRLGANSQLFNLQHSIKKATGIPDNVLRGRKPTEECSFAQRMSWAASRTTTRPEDMAYSLFGLFNVNLPILYGEGALKAFRRLQLEIMENSVDQTLFAWTRDDSPASDGLLADSVSVFRNSGSVESWNPWLYTLKTPTMTKFGIKLALPTRSVSLFGSDIRQYIAMLPATIRDEKGTRKPFLIYLSSPPLFKPDLWKQLPTEIFERRDDSFTKAMISKMDVEYNMRRWNDDFKLHEVLVPDQDQQIDYEKSFAWETMGPNGDPNYKDKFWQ